MTLADLKRPTDLLIKIETDRQVAEEQVAHAQGMPASSSRHYSRPTRSPSHSSDYIYIVQVRGVRTPNRQRQMVTPSYIKGV